MAQFIIVTASEGTFPQWAEEDMRQRLANKLGVPVDRIIVVEGATISTVEVDSLDPAFTG